MNDIYIKRLACRVCACLSKNCDDCFHIAGCKWISAIKEQVIKNEIADGYRCGFCGEYTMNCGGCESCKELQVVDVCTDCTIKKCDKKGICPPPNFAD